jgi:DNA-binding transcriptional regulator LsrR (DeoR family)
VHVHHPIATCLGYADLLKTKYKLTECNVVPVTKDENILDSICFGGAQVLRKYLDSEDSQTIGIGSGTTLKLSVNHLESRDHSYKQCVSLISAIGLDGKCNYYDDVSLIFASRIKANYYQLAAPRYAHTPDEMTIWCGNDFYRQHLAMADQCDVIFVGIGQLGDTGPILNDGFISSEESAELESQGCIGEVIGRFINIDGDIINTRFNQLVTSYDIRRNNNRKIAIAGGVEKRNAILGALNGGWINGLVTDELTAKWLLTC